jgi:hypothetical protein
MLNWKKYSGRKSEGGWRKGELIGSKPPVVMWLWLWRIGSWKEAAIQRTKSESREIAIVVSLYEATTSEGTKTELHGFSQQVNYTDRETAVCLKS